MLDCYELQRAIRNKIDKLLVETRMYPIEELRRCSSDFNGQKVKSVMENSLGDFLSKFREAILPEESQLQYSLPYNLKDSSWIFDALENKTIIAVDTSSISPSVHISPIFLLINVGLQLVSYKRHAQHEEASIPFFFTALELREFSRKPYIPSWVEDIKRMECQHEVIKDYLEKGGDRPIILFDESLSAGYLSGKIREHRVNIANKLSEILNSLRDVAIPVGVYYTRSKGFLYSFLKQLKCSSVKCGGKDCEYENICKKYTALRDAKFLNAILDSGQRTCVFRIENKVTQDEECELGDIYGFYLKIEDGNVVRVEFPKLTDNSLVTEIHKAVLAQAYLGKGYPYVLERAHEQAYISYSERRWIENFIRRCLAEKSKSIDLLRISAKEERKRRGVI